jgi:uncharacterized protein (TIGR02145 family)
MGKFIPIMLTASLAISCSVGDGSHGIDGANGIDGENGKDANCIISPNKVDTYDVICNGKKIGELSSGKNGTNCDIIDIGTYFTMKCEEEERAKWPKALCGTNAYDPATKTCDNRDNKTYKYVKIGEQYWLAENMNYEANDGICYLNYFSYCEKYGKLYNWQTAQTICPTGWHLPNDDEWAELTAFVNVDAGKKLKTADNWNDSYGTDDYNFAALPGGYSHLGNFYYERNRSFWWSASEYSFDHSGANIIYVSNNNNAVSRHYCSKEACLLSVRCVKN